MTEKRLTRRRWFQFSLRTLLVATMFVAFGGAWVGMQLQQKRRHEAVVNEIVKSGGSVHVSEVVKAPVWKEWIFGSYAVRPVCLELVRTNATDSLLSETQGLNLVDLNLTSSKITDAGLTHLKGLTRLACLDLSNTQITDSGLIHLKGLTSMTHLNLDKTQVTDAGVGKLQQAIPTCMIYYYPKEITSAPTLPP